MNTTDFRALSAHEIDSVAGGSYACVLPSSLTSLAVSVTKVVTKTTNIASGNTATQTGTVSGAGSYLNQAQLTGNFANNSAIIVLV